MVYVWGISDADADGYYWILDAAVRSCKRCFWGIYVIKCIGYRISCDADQDASMAFKLDALNAEEADEADAE